MPEIRNSIAVFKPDWCPDGFVILSRQAARSQRDTFALAFDTYGFPLPVAGMQNRPLREIKRALVKAARYVRRLPHHQYDREYWTRIVNETIYEPEHDTALSLPRSWEQRRDLAAYIKLSREDAAAQQQELDEFCKKVKDLRQGVLDFQE